jgi:hypothetical protein
MFFFLAAEVTPRNEMTASYLENHISKATWFAYVVECTEDYNLLYREIREKRNVPITIVKVNNGKFQANQRMYSEERMDVLKREHGFECYLDETFTASDPIMAALVVSEVDGLDRFSSRFTHPLTFL